MKVAAVERPEKTDNDQVNRNDIVQHSRHLKKSRALEVVLRLPHRPLLANLSSQCASDSTQHKECESNDQNESKYAGADVHVDLQIASERTLEHYETKQSGRHRT
jgi:hypothetical protein